LKKIVPKKSVSHFSGGWVLLSRAKRNYRLLPKAVVVVAVAVAAVAVVAVVAAVAAAAAAAAAQQQQQQ
jgi:hypothetical protein